MSSLLLDMVAGLRGVAAVAAAFLWGRALLGPHLSGLRPLERAVASLLAATVAVGGFGLTLAVAGIFHGWLLALVLVVVAAVALPVHRRRVAPIGERAPTRRTDLALLACAAALAALAWPPFPSVLGGRDPGVYVNTAALVRDRHAIAVSWPGLGRIPIDVRSHLSGGTWPGFYVDPAGSDRVVPQGFHFLPALIAAAGAASGGLGLWVLPLASVLALLAWALLAERLAAGPAAAVAGPATAAVLAASVAWVWQARSALTEPTAALCIGGGLWLWSLAAARDDERLAGLAGVVLGAALFVRIDGVLIGVALAGQALWLVLAGRFRRATAAWVGGFAVMAAAAAAYAWLFTPVYVREVFRLNVSPGLARLGLPAAAVAVGAALTAPVAARRGTARLIAAGGGWLDRAVTLAAIAGCAVVPLGVLRGWRGMQSLRWYATDLGLLAAAAGLVLLVRGGWRRDRLEGAGALVLAVAVTLAVYGDNPHILDEHFWAGRRFVPVVLPALALLAGVAAAALAAVEGRWRRTARATLAVGGALTLAGLGTTTWPVVGHVEHAGAPEGVALVDTSLGAAETLVLVDERQGLAARLAAPLACLSRREVYAVSRLDDRHLAPWLAAQARVRPVRVIAAGEGPPPLDTTRLRAVHEKALCVTVPEFDQPDGRLPTGSHPLVMPMVVWRLLPVEADPIVAATP